MTAAREQRFELEVELGSGGMGVVYRAFDRERDAWVALKMLHDVAPASLMRFKREFRALQDIDHPNLVRLGELFIEPDRCFYTMELVEGVDFLTFVGATSVRPPPPTTRPIDGRGGRRLPTPLPIEEVHCDEARLRRGLRQLVAALASLHEIGLVHRDIKPHNVLVTDDERLVLVDFGLASPHGAALESAGHLIGTAAYMAPEQIGDVRAAPAADWYAVGVVLYEALTGRLPFDGNALEILTRKGQFEPPPPRALVPSVPHDLDELCAALLHTRPDDRPGTDEILARVGLTEPPTPAAGRERLLTAEIALLGRDPELERLFSAFEDVDQHRPVTVVVRGQSGIGKSTLLRELADQLRGRDDRVVVLHGRSYERESVPFNGFDGIVDALTSHLRRLPPEQLDQLVPDDAALATRLFPVLGRVAALTRGPRSSRFGDAHVVRQRAFAALRELLARLARSAPLVLISDDLQWADGDTLQLFDAILRPPDPPGLLVLLSARGDTAVELPGEIRELELGPLPSTDAATLAARLMAHAGVDLDGIDALVAHAGGHPLYIDELVRHAAAGGGAIDALSLGDAIWQRVEALPAPARELLAHLCVADEPISEGTAREASRISPIELDRAVALLRAHNLVRATPGYDQRRLIEPYHNQIRATVTARLDAEYRRRCHAGLAEALQAAGEADTRPAAVLRHLLAIDADGPAAALAERAAARAEAGFAFERASELYRLALDRGDHDPEHRRRLQIACADSAVRCGRGGAAVELYLAAADGADPTTTLACRTAAARELLIHGRLERGLATLNQLLAEAGETLPRTNRTAVARLVWHRARLRARGLHFTPRHERQIAEHDLRRLELFQSVATGLGMIDPVRAQVFQTRALMLALRLGEPTRVAEALAYEGMFHAANGNIARARAVLEVLAAVLDQRDDPYVRGLLAAATAATHHFASEFRAGVDGFAEAERILREQPRNAWGELGKSKILSLVALRMMGRYHEARGVLESSLRDAAERGDGFTRTSLLRAMNSVWLVDDDPDGATAALAAATWSPLPGAVHVQHWFDMRARSEIHLYRGAVPDPLDIDGELGRFERSLLARMPILAAEFYWMHSRLWLNRLDHGEDPARCLAAIARPARALARVRMPWAAPFAQLIAAAAAHRKGDRERAIELTGAAIDSGTRAETYLVAAAARVRRGQLTGAREDVERGAGETRGQGVRNLERWLAVLAPGFADLPPVG